MDGGVGKVGAVGDWKALCREVGGCNGLGRRWRVVCGEGCEMWVGGFVVGRIYVCGCGEG